MNRLEDRVEQMEWTPNRILALIVGVIFTLLGIVGFFVSSSMTPGRLLGFDVDLVHNLVHLITGLIGLAAAFTGWSRLFNQVFGIVYLLLGIAGLFYPGLYFSGRLLGIMHVNAADHWLHIIAGVIAIAVGFFVQEYPTRSTRPTY